MMPRAGMTVCVGSHPRRLTHTGQRHPSLLLEPPLLHHLGTWWSPGEYKGNHNIVENLVQINLNYCMHMPLLYSWLRVLEVGATIRDYAG